jgi:hypothetical protein
MRGIHDFTAPGSSFEVEATVAEPMIDLQSPGFSESEHATIRRLVKFCFDRNLDLEVSNRGYILTGRSRGSFSSSIFHHKPYPSLQIIHIKLNTFKSLDS